jgi:hypothetical protein
MGLQSIYNASRPCIKAVSCVTAWALQRNVWHSVSPNLTGSFDQLVWSGPDPKPRGGPPPCQSQYRTVLVCHSTARLSAGAKFGQGILRRGLCF